MSQQVIQANGTGVSRLTPCGPIQRFNRFLDSPWYLVLIGLLTAASNILGADLIVYSIFIAIAVCISLFGTDFLALMVLPVCCYIAPSTRNNPGRNPDSVFFPENGGLYLVFLFAVFLACVIYRLVRDKELGGIGFLKHKRKLMPGMLLLGGAYLLGGVFSGRYFANGVLAPAFALLQFLAIAALYWFFCGAVRWERVPRNYFAWMGLVIGLTVCLETLGIYCINDVLLDGVIDASNIYTGWGNKNNLGAVIAMTVPFGLCLVRREKHGWVFSILTLFMMAVLCLTCSRTSIFFAVVIYALTALLILMDPQWRKPFFWHAGISSGIILLALIIILRGEIAELIGKFWSPSFDSMNDRFEDYQKGIDSFKLHPIFGETFYPSRDIYVWAQVDFVKEVLPARWHNTFIQLLTSCGIVGLTCYVIHRMQTVALFWKKRRTDMVFIGLSLSCLLLMSMLDCHFFNVGPTLFYSTALAFAEHSKEAL